MVNNFRRTLFLNIGIGFGILLIFILAMVIVGIDAKKNADYIFETNTVITSRSRIAADLSRLREQKVLADPILNDLLAKVPDKDSLFSFSAYIKSLAARHNATSSLRFGEESQEEGFNSIRFNINAQGDYSSAVDFLNDFDSVPYFINTSSFSIIRQAEKYTVVIEGDIMFRE